MHLQARLAIDPRPRNDRGATLASVVARLIPVVVRAGRLRDRAHEVLAVGGIVDEELGEARGVTELLVETWSDQTPTYEWRATSLDNAVQTVIPSTSEGFLPGRLVVSVSLLESLVGAMAVVDVDVTISLSRTRATTSWRCGSRGPRRGSTTGTRLG